jgi:hypothetical protein
MILLNLIMKKWDVGVWTASGWVRIGTWDFLEGRAHLEDPDLNWIVLLNKEVGCGRMDCIELGQVREI